MATIAEIDTYYIKGISALHSKDHLIVGNKPLLQTMLEEAIKGKTGQERNLTPIVQSFLKLSGIDGVKPSLEDQKAPALGSDNELELDLLKEDLMCIICQGIDVTARNRLLECSDCRCLYHQECHQPPVTQGDADAVWICSNCKQNSVSVVVSSSTYPVTIKTKISSPSHKHGEKKQQ